MLTIINYRLNENIVPEIKQYIKQYAIEQYALIKYQEIQDMEELLTSSAKICLISYDDYLNNIESLKNWKKANKAKFIFITEDYFQMLDIIRNTPAEYCLLSPVLKETMLSLVEHIRLKIKSNIIAIKLGHSGEEVIEVKNLNYINIVNRNLRFYMVDKTEINSQTLRQSFAKEITPMLTHKELFFMMPSLLVNLENIKQLYDGYIVFKNEEKLYYPKLWHEKLRAAWLDYYENF